MKEQSPICLFRPHVRPSVTLALVGSLMHEMRTDAIALHSLGHRTWLISLEM